MTGSDGITWTAQTPAANISWSGVTYGNGKFVAVSASGVADDVMTSPDGITWTIRTGAQPYSWRDVTFGNNTFVAVGINAGSYGVMTSTDGITWDLRLAGPSNSWRSVTFGNGLFVAVSNSGIGNRVITSPDGINWTTRTSAADNSWQGITYGNGLFVAVSSSGGTSRVMTSPDGLTWTLRTSAVANSWNSITYGRGVFVAVSITGTGDKVMTSPDGITWTSQTSAADNQWSAVAYGNGVFAAVANFGAADRVMTSGTLGVLPVTHLNFSGRTSNGTNYLLWQTATETNTKHFEIERSKNGVAFYKIGTVLSAGNSDNTKNYSFTDAMPQIGANYYRLKQLDLDGKFEYSNIIVVTSKAITASVFPNPAGNRITIHTDSDNLNSIAQVYSITGKLEQTISIKTVDQAIDISRLAKGVYTIRMNNGSAVQFVKE